MIRLLTLLLASVAFAPAQAELLPSPAGPGAMAPALAATPNGTVLLSWLEPAGEETWRLRFSRFDAAQKRWDAARTVAQGPHWFVNWADIPTITPLAEETWMAVWFVENHAAPGAAAGHHGAGYHAVYSLTYDAGQTWSKPQATTGESGSVEFVAVLALGENSRALAAWLDGRQRQSGGADQQALYAQTLLATGPDQLVDRRVCDCCPLALARVPGGALLAYRGRDADEIRDIRLARWDANGWAKPAPLHPDGWKISGCPVNGPRLAARGPRVAATWFTAAQDQPRVQVKFSPDAGATWGAPVRVDLGRPQGRLDCVLRADGAALVSWLELTGTATGRDGGIYLRTVRPDGSMDEPRLLAATKTTRASGFPRMVALPNGQLVLAYTQDEEPSRIATLLLEPK